MGMDWKSWIVILVGLMAWAMVAQAGDYEFGALTDAGTSKLELRAGAEIGETWTVGLLTTWYGEESPYKWGGGAYAKMLVEPAAVLPLKEWLPKIGSWLNLPDTVTAETYVIPKFEVVPYEGGVDMAGSLGAGVQVGPAVLEYVYQVVESGDSDNPLLFSGPVMWFGLCIDL